MAIILYNSAISIASERITLGYNPYVDKEIPKSLDSFGSGKTCNEINKRVSVPSLIYTISPEGVAKDVYCDMNDFGGGWTLLYSFGEEPVSDKALYFGGIKTKEDLEQSNLITKYTHLNYKKYALQKDAIQIFYTGEENGFIQFTIPNFASKIRVDSNTINFNGKVKFLRNDQEIFSINKRTNKSPVYFSVSPGDKVKIQEEGILWISSIWAK